MFILNKCTLFNLKTSFYYIFFKKKKKFKRSLILKTYLMLHLRKILLSIKLNKFNVMIKGLPVFFKQLIKILITPLNITFKNKFDDNLIKDELSKPYFNIIINFLFFLKSISFCFFKTKRKRRLKRKITRKLFTKNNLFI
jgi:hypothetical protein